MVRKVVAGAVSPLAALLLSGLLVYESFSYEVNAVTEALAFLLSGAIGARIVNGRAGLPVAIGMSLVFGSMFAVAGSVEVAEGDIPRDSILIAVYVIGAIVAAELYGRRREAHRFSDGSDDTSKIPS